ncbi:MAG: hypothetical protein IJS96_01805 [Schwartzia sp.]|nr:hypothetical protein [Schwartzia sp. (in: firmicutes)]
MAVKKHDTSPAGEEKGIDLSGLPKSVNADKMTDEELIMTLREGIEKVLAGERGIPVEDFDREFRARHKL